MLKKIIIGIILNAAALFGVTYFLTQIQYAGGVTFFIIGGVVMGILNTIVKPVLKILTLPIHILTVGISLVLLNGVIFWIFDVVLDTIVVKGVTLTVPSIKTYFLAGFLFGLINWVEHFLVHNK